MNTVATQIFLDDLMGSNVQYNVTWNRLNQFQINLNDATYYRKKLDGQLWYFISVYMGILCVAHGIKTPYEQALVWIYLQLYLTAKF